LRKDFEMILNTHINGTSVKFDTSVFHDLSLGVNPDENHVSAYFIPPPTFEPFRAGSFVGSVLDGGACNCYNITFNAHGNGTHTECVGHISKEPYTINAQLINHFCVAKLISAAPIQQENGDFLLGLEVLNGHDLVEVEALVLRTLPNVKSKINRHYSGTNPCYLSPELTTKLADLKITHLIIDLPSVDREEDGGALLAHHAFWNYPNKTRQNATITELAFVPDAAEDGLYILNLQIAPFDSDASPSKPFLYPINA
jgi:arylformamidase